MNRLANLFSSSFDTRTHKDIYDELELLHSNCADEFYIIANDYKRTMVQLGDGKEDQNIYAGNEQRLRIVQSVDTDCLKSVNQTSNEYHVLGEVVIIGAMIERIEDHLQHNQKLYRLLFDMFGKIVGTDGLAESKYIRSEPEKVQDTNAELITGGLGDYEDFSIAYNDDARLVIKVGIRDLTLIAIMMCLYVFHDAIEYVFDFYGHMNLATHHVEQLRSNDVFDDESNSSVIADKIDPGMGVDVINKAIFAKFHVLVHVMGKTYNSQNVKCQFEICQLWYLMKSLVLVSLYTGGTDFIDTRLLMDRCEEKCALVQNGIEGAMSNALLASIYIFNKAYSWFDYKEWSRYLQYYGGTVRVMGIFIHDRERYNMLYALGVLYAIRFINVSLSSPMFSVVKTVDINKFSRNDLPFHNGAFLYKVRDNDVRNKNNLYVIEVQDRILYTSDKKNAHHESFDSFLTNNQVMNDNQNKIDSFIIYNVLNQRLNNVEYICYNIDELRKVLGEYRDGKRGLVNGRPRDSKVRISKQIAEMERTIDRTNMIMRIVGFIALVSIISFYVFAYRNPKHMEYKQSVNDLSLY